MNSEGVNIELLTERKHPELCHLIYQFVSQMKCINCERLPEGISYICEECPHIFCEDCLKSDVNQFCKGCSVQLEYEKFIVDPYYPQFYKLLITLRNNSSRNF